MVPSILAWRIPWTEQPGRPQSTGSQRVGHDWTTSLSLSISITYRIKFLAWHWRSFIINFNISLKHHFLPLFNTHCTSHHKWPPQVLYLLPLLKFFHLPEKPFLLSLLDILLLSFIAKLKCQVLSKIFPLLQPLFWTQIISSISVFPQYFSNASYLRPTELWISLSLYAQRFSASAEWVNEHMIQKTGSVVRSTIWQKKRWWYLSSQI